MKKLITLLLSIIMTFCALSALCACSPEEENDPVDSTGISNLVYRLSDDGEYYMLVGFGMHDENDVIIPASYSGKPVRVIGRKAFNADYVWEIVHSVTLPESVKTIEEYAFNGCKNMTSVTFAKGLEYIGFDAFKNCASLKSAELPDGLLTIEETAFIGCTSLETVRIPDSVTSIGRNAFLGTKFMASGTSKLDKVTYALTPDVKAWVLVSEMNNVDANLPDNAIGIAAGAFATAGANLKTVEIPAGVKYICRDAFKNCTKLETVYYGGSAEDFAKISIADGNECLTNANVVYAK